MTGSSDAQFGTVPGRTVGSLLGVPLGRADMSEPAAGPTAVAVRSQAVDEGNSLPAGEIEGPGWIVAGGEPRTGVPPAGIRGDGVEALDFNNPFGQTMERVWFEGKVVYAIDCGPVDVDPDRVAVAQEYQTVYDVALDDQGKLTRPPETVTGQYNIYDSVPGMEKYSPIWQFNYVVVPRDYRANALRSEADCVASGFPILRSRVFEN